MMMMMINEVNTMTPRQNDLVVKNKETLHPQKVTIIQYGINCQIKLDSSNTSGTAFSFR